MRSAYKYEIQFTFKRANSVKKNNQLSEVFLYHSSIKMIIILLHLEPHLNNINKNVDVLIGNKGDIS